MAQGKKTGGRQAGTLNKATLEVKEAARQYAPAALKRLYEIMETGESDAAKVSAAREILDRAYGKSTQAVTAEQNITVQNKLSESDKEIIRHYQEQHGLQALADAGFSVNHAKSYEENLLMVRQQRGV